MSQLGCQTGRRVAVCTIFLLLRGNEPLVTENGFETGLKLITVDSFQVLPNLVRTGELCCVV